jgi:hypothetical protein
MAQTGPKFDRGKAVSSRNAEMHGIFSTTPVLDIEDPAEWERHRQGILDSTEPEGHLETFLADRIASLTWRMQRVVRYETGMLSLGMDFDDDADTIAILTRKAKGTDIERQRAEEARRHFIVPRLIPGELTGPNTMRYEAHLHRQWLQTQHELEAMQTRRKGGASPLARVDITAAPGG